MPEIVQDIGAYAGIASVVGLAVLSALYFSQARDVKRLREWAGRAPERSEQGATAVPGRVVATPQQPNAPAPPPVPVPGRAAPAAQPAPGAQPGAAPAAGRPPAATPAGQAAPAAAASAGAGPATAQQAKPGAVAGGQNANAGAGGEGAAAAGGAGGAAAGGAGGAAGPAAAGAAAAGAKPSTDGPGADAAKPDVPGAGEPGPGAATASASGAPTAAKPDAPAGAAPSASPSGPAVASGPAAPAQRPAAPLGQRPGPPTPPRQGASTVAASRGASAPSVPGNQGRFADRPGASSRPSPQQTAILPPKSKRPGGLSPRYLIVVLAGLVVLGGAAVYGIVQLTGDDTGGGSQSAATDNGDTNDGQGERRRGGAVKPGNVTVAVLNGTTVPGLAATLSDEVGAAGFKVGTITNFSDQQLAESVVQYAPGHQAEARAVSRRLGIAQREPVNPSTQALAGDATVVVIAGSDKAP